MAISGCGALNRVQLQASSQTMYISESRSRRRTRSGVSSKQPIMFREPPCYHPQLSFRPLLSIIARCVLTLILPSHRSRPSPCIHRTSLYVFPSTFHTIRVFFSYFLVHISDTVYHRRFPFLLLLRYLVNGMDQVDLFYITLFMMDTGTLTLAHTHWHFISIHYDLSFMSLYATT